MKTVNRPYTSPRRLRQAAETRRAILEAALELFTRQGYAATSIREVAELASVSDQTIYKAFGDKAGLLSAAGDHYMETGGGGADAAFLAALDAEPDLHERIRMVARSSRELWESGALELDLMLSSSEVHDPRLVDLQRRSLEYKLMSNRAVCERLFPDESRRPGFDIDGIAAFGTAFDSAATVATLQALGWTMDDWERWLVDLLSLFNRPTDARR